MGFDLVMLLLYDGFLFGQLAAFVRFSFLQFTHFCLFIIFALTSTASVYHLAHHISYIFGNYVE